MGFDKHGSYTIDQYKDILLTTVQGSTSSELIVEYLTEIYGIAKNYKKERWAEICDGRDWEFTTLEGINDFMKTVKIPEYLQYISTDIVFITKNTLHKELIKKFFLEIRDKNHVYFPDSIEQALDILHKEGYTGQIP